MLSYPVQLTPDTNGTLLVTFPDVPEAITVGEYKNEALVNAEEALEAALEIYFSEKRLIPLPSKAKRGQETITLSALVTSKVLLANEMVSQGVRKADLARRLNVHMPQVDRLLDLRHSSKIESVEEAFGALGKRLEISIV